LRFPPQNFSSLLSVFCGPYRGSTFRFLLPRCFPPYTPQFPMFSYCDNPWVVFGVFYLVGPACPPSIFCPSTFCSFFHSFFFRPRSFFYHFFWVSFSRVFTTQAFRAFLTKTPTPSRFCVFCGFQKQKTILFSPRPPSPPTRTPQSPHFILGFNVTIFCFFFYLFFPPIPLQARGLLLGGVFYTQPSPPLPHRFKVFFLFPPVFNPFL